MKRKETDQILRQKEEEELMKQKMETDYMYHMYELEKSKQRHDKQNQISKTNLKIAVRIYYRKKSVKKIILFLCLFLK